MPINKNQVKEFCDLIKKRRLQLEWSIEFLALVSDVSQGTISKIERGKQIPKLDAVEKLCEALNIEIKYNPKHGISPKVKDILEKHGNKIDKLFDDKKKADQRISELKKSLFGEDKKKK